MIISASYRTDIPTFYGAWLMNRLRAGYCLVQNPYSGKAHRVSLAREDVDGFVFWTKNAGPFLEQLDEIWSRGFPFVVQHTINDYPRALETSVVDAKRSVELAHRLARFGPRVLVWRYDTIVTSSLTPPELHVERFGALAEQLRGATDEVVVSFLHPYEKTRRNLDRAAAERGFEWHDPPLEAKRGLAGRLAELAATHGMRLTVCSQRDYVVTGASAARCIDARRLEDVRGTTIRARLSGNRPECACFESRDIGDYDSCPHGCLYCYAVRDRSRAAARHRRHDPDAEMLMVP
ncbi:MAG: DUF1848 domain-containing protein [Deltaproteobacteria bacterium]|nr:DUF1848 domain-containing protein [Deltaproteobacteria bacterium]